MAGKHQAGTAQRRKQEMNRTYGEFTLTGEVLDVVTRQVFPSVDAWQAFTGDRDGFLIVHFPPDKAGRKQAKESLIRALTAKKG